jgi:hypothetical protein
MPRDIRLNAVSPGWVLETRLAFGHGLISRHTGGRSRSRLCAKC